MVEHNAKHGGRFLLLLINACHIPEQLQKNAFVRMGFVVKQQIKLEFSARLALHRKNNVASMLPHILIHIVGILNNRLG